MFCSMFVSEYLKALYAGLAYANLGPGHPNI